ncbi:MAG: hypothetical protein JRG71_06945 [Deltaproteobacteria bacterium]|nr:hypothetical protein [Deltaproteobacteria bacterium]
MNNVAYGSPHHVTLDRGYLEKHLSEVAAASCALMAIEKVLQQHSDAVHGDDVRPDFFIMTGLFHSVRCLANDIHEIEEMIKEEMESPWIAVGTGATAN